MAILSIQSHVSYGYVGNRVATHALQNLGFEVWCVNTVNFSNHTGYGTWQGEIFAPDAVQHVVDGIKKVADLSRCQAVLSGYVGDPKVGQVILKAVEDFAAQAPDLIYLCDPVMGDVGRGFFVKEGILHFFKNLGLQKATIMTPNHFEMDALCDRPLKTIEDAKAACREFHQAGVHIIAITSFDFIGLSSSRLSVFLSTPQGAWVGETDRVLFDVPPNGTGDLFSALYLGNFLQKRDPVSALEKTLQSVYKIVALTGYLNQRELAIVQLLSTMESAMINTTPSLHANVSIAQV